MKISEFLTWIKEVMANPQPFPHRRKINSTDKKETLGILNLFGITLNEGETGQLEILEYPRYPYSAILLLTLYISTTQNCKCGGRCSFRTFKIYKTQLEKVLAAKL